MTGGVVGYSLVAQPLLATSVAGLFGVVVLLRHRTPAVALVGAAAGKPRAPRPVCVNRRSLRSGGTRSWPNGPGSRELHDLVAHSVSVIAALAETAPFSVDELPPAGRQRFAEFASAARGALGELRDLLSVLRRDDPRTRVSAAIPCPISTASTG
ncbi:MAG: histidine kinase dimerization/phosphoacceptor domain-containing protein [Gammaproteobacteria bacterium]